MGANNGMGEKEKASLVDLEAAIKKDLQYINYPPREWLKPKKTKSGKHIYDVMIIGGGQTGLALYLALRREQITNVAIIDENKRNQSGAWVNFGKMKTLRTPKYTIGPENDIPSLTFQSWYSTKYTIAQWEALDYIPRMMWHDYLCWFRDVLNIPVFYEHKAGFIEWDKGNSCFSVPINHKGSKKTLYARKVVYAVGLQGSGSWMIPDFVKNKINKDKYVQAVYKIDPDKVRGKRVAVLGAGPCGFDITLELNKKGAKFITMFSKRKKLVNLHCFKWGEFVGFLKSADSGMKCNTVIEREYNRRV